MTFASKLFVALSGAALLFAVIYGLSAQGSMPITLLVAAAVSAGLAAVVTTAVGGRDLAPIVALDAPPPDARAVTPGPPAKASMWPLVAAAGGALAAVGAAVGIGWLIAGLLVALLASAGWFGRSWREHPLWTPRVRERVKTRVVLPASLFWLVFLSVVVIAICFSRILLAVPEKASVAVALAMAVVLLVAFFVIASQTRTTRSVITTLAVVTALALGGAGLAGGLKGERKYERVAVSAPGFNLVAQNTNFQQTDFQAKPGQQVLVDFHNLDRGTYHNFSVYEKDSSGGQGIPVFNGKPINGGSIAYKFAAPQQPGDYIFACDFHANMRGTLTVTSS